MTSLRPRPWLNPEKRRSNIAPSIGECHFLSRRKSQVVAYNNPHSRVKRRVIIFCSGCIAYVFYSLLFSSVNINPLMRYKYYHHEKNSSSSSSSSSLSFYCNDCEETNITTCAEIFARYPNLVEKCLVDPNQNQCTINCPDLPVLSSSFGNAIPSLWPSIHEGKWIDDPTHCLAVRNTTQECFHGKYRLDVPGFMPVTPSQACATFSKHGVTEIKMVGDSLGRHLWQGLAMLLADDIRKATFGKGPPCVDDAAFSEANCRFDGAGTGDVVTVCHNSITVRFQASQGIRDEQVPPLVVDNTDGKSLLLYSVGNHPGNGRQDGLSRNGILNVTAYQSTKWRTFDDEPYFWGKGHYMIWIPPHFKIRVGRIDESNERALTFLQESSHYFARLGAPTLNTFTMTKLPQDSSAYHATMALTSTPLATICQKAHANSALSHMMDITIRVT
eukprot:CAMPEP_0172418540 /NCGR_PEP_ID=MMETSP1064-20121228/5013_1 /TAXON_ID=202472 /ORGANISM="Aulacoseira subarctica , Strain CCAP 1002/5" /LENGTH=443 /DNA_ID=CAMNT_0013157517 /DNA_START=41 /DNA_END=1372 /DNA_ORIENTATION=-